MLSDGTYTDVVTTLFRRQQRCYNVETTSCAYWENIKVSALKSANKYKKIRNLRRGKSFCYLPIQYIYHPIRKVSRYDFNCYEAYKKNN